MNWRKRATLLWPWRQPRPIVVAARLSNQHRPRVVYTVCILIEGPPHIVSLFKQSVGWFFLAFLFFPLLFQMVKPFCCRIALALSLKGRVGKRPTDRSIGLSSKSEWVKGRTMYSLILSFYQTVFKRSVARGKMRRRWRRFSFSPDWLLSFIFWSACPSSVHSKCHYWRSTDIVLFMNFSRLNRVSMSWRKPKMMSIDDQPTVFICPDVDDVVSYQTKRPKRWMTMMTKGLCWALGQWSRNSITFSRFYWSAFDVQHLLDNFWTIGTTRTTWKALSTSSFLSIRFFFVIVDVVVCFALSANFHYFW